MTRWGIPKTWKWVTIGEIAEVVGGGTPSTKDPSNFGKKGIPWLTPFDLSGYEDAYIRRGARDLSEKGYASCGAQLMPKGTVLFTSRAPIGYCAIASNEISTNQGFKSLVLYSDTVPEYIRYYLLASKDYAESFASGSTFRELSGSRMKILEVPLPGVQEQRRIVDKVKDIQKATSAAWGHIQAIPPLTERLRISILNNAFSGRLTADWRKSHPNVEPAGLLLEHIRKERRQRWIEAELEKFKQRQRKQGWSDSKIEQFLPEQHKRTSPKYIEPKPVNKANLPELPKGWCWATLDELCYYVTSGSRDWSKFYSETGALFIRTEDINTNELRLDKVAYVDLPEDVEGKRSLVQRGDLLFTITGANVGKCAFVRNDVPEAYVSQSIALVKLVRPEVGRYVHLTCIAPNFGAMQLEELAYGVGRPVLNLDNIRELNIPVAPPAEQKRIAEILDDYLSKIDSLSEKVEQIAELSQYLNTTILEKAFRGELLPQDPNDEPASVLLERVRAERELAEVGESKRRRTSLRKSRKRSKREPKVEYHEETESVRPRAEVSRYSNLKAYETLSENARHLLLKIEETIGDREFSIEEIAALTNFEREELKNAFFELLSPFPENKGDESPFIKMKFLGEKGGYVYMLARDE
ncbi:MAG: restriction endonuclease subunit S [Candidatus Hodarchaeota archaeon]